MDRPLRAAVIGLGSMGANHARVLGTMDGVELAAVVDADPERLAAVTSGRSGVIGYTDHNAMLAEVRPDMVCVVAPTRMHHRIALDTINAGAHLLVEKPIAATVDEARAIAEAAGKAGVTLTVGHIERYNPAVQELGSRIAAGQGGRIFQLRARRVGPFPHRIRDVGVIHDLAPHDIDVMRYLLRQDVGRVYAEAQGHIHTDNEDILAGMLHFTGGATGVLDINWLTPTKERTLTVLCEKGLFIADYAAQSLEFYENHAATAREGTVASVTEGPMTRYLVPNREPLRVELEAFRDAVRDGVEPAVTATDGMAALAVAEALVTSAERHEPVTITPELTHR